MKILKRVNIKLLIEYKIAESDEFSKKLTHRDYIKLSDKIKNFVYPQLKENHFHWPDLDADIELEALKKPEKYILRYR